MKNLFITIDGVDGVGKTTVAKILASDGSFQYYKSPAGPFVQLRKEIDTHATPLERYCFYRLATHFDSIQITNLLKTGSVVCDRYILSTAIYHIALDPRIKIIHNDLGIIKPNFEFILDARSEVRDKRILERPKILSDSILERDSLFLDRVAKMFTSLKLNHIDTSDMNAENVASKIRNILKKGGIT